MFPLPKALEIGTRKTPVVELRWRDIKIFNFGVAAGLSNPNMGDLICSSHQLYFMVSPGTMNSQKGTRMGQDTLKDFITSMFQLCFSLLRPSSNLFCSRVKSCDSFHVCTFLFWSLLITSFFFLHRLPCKHSSSLVYPFWTWGSSPSIPF